MKYVAPAAFLVIAARQFLPWGRVPAPQTADESAIHTSKFHNPDTNTTRSTMGADYSLTPNLRINAGYQGNYATAEHGHTWNMGLTYRFAIP